MNRGPSLEKVEPGYELLKWAFVDESLPLRVSTWSGIVSSRRALEYSFCLSKLRSHSCDGSGMCCKCLQKGRLNNCCLEIRPAEGPWDGHD
ncbi:unnamed protein product [Soboliphyme baturini]|uniref:Ovule protein n=1 Tax=Soboliphyme baturini TaxID=241478 RepID=A0A183IJG3_9BILA|nr:unnamed protein product [Soboliphyme baturini]